MTRQLDDMKEMPYEKQGNELLFWIDMIAHDSIAYYSDLFFVDAMMILLAY